MTAKYKILTAVVVVIVALDQWTKALILSAFYLGKTVPYTPFFSLTYVQNRGAAFGFCNNCPPGFRDTFFLVVPISVLLVILGMIYKLPEKASRWTAFALSLIVSGAIGNLIDRARFGYVVDFLLFHYQMKWQWPAFNVADSCIVVGVGIMLLQGFFPKLFGQSPSS